MENFFDFGDCLSESGLIISKDDIEELDDNIFNETDIDLISDNPTIGTFNQSEQTPSMDLDIPNKKKRRAYKPLSEEKRIKRNNRRRKIPLTKIVKTDICRYYPTMIANLFNAGDLDLLDSFLNVYFISNFHFIDTYGKQAMIKKHSFCEKFAPFNFLQGKDAVIKYTETLHTISPDFTMILSDAQIRSRSDSSLLTVVAKYEYHSTLFFEQQLDEMDKVMKQLLSNGNEIKQTGEGLVAIGPNAEEVMEIINRKKARNNTPMIFTPARSPQLIESSTYLFMQVNEARQVLSLEIVDSLTSPEEYMLSLSTPSWRIQDQTTQLLRS